MRTRRERTEILQRASLNLEVVLAVWALVWTSALIVKLGQPHRDVEM